ncbi:MAG: hypothetical protein AB2556_26255 [Candidatus Thiodiazotropha sp.]
MAGRVKLQSLDFGESGTDIFEERAIDGYAGHAMGRVPEPGEPGFRFTQAL